MNIVAELIVVDEQTDQLTNTTRVATKSGGTNPQPSFTSRMHPEATRGPIVFGEFVPWMSKPDSSSNRART
jgi:hypothetical protein